MLLLQGAWVQSLVEELRHCKLHSEAKKKKKGERERKQSGRSEEKMLAMLLALIWKKGTMCHRM